MYRADHPVLRLYDFIVDTRWPLYRAKKLETVDVRNGEFFFVPNILCHDSLKHSLVVSESSEKRSSSHVLPPGIISVCLKPRRTAACHISVFHGLEFQSLGFLNSVGPLWAIFHAQTNYKNKSDVPRFLTSATSVQLCVRMDLPTPLIKTSVTRSYKLPILDLTYRCHALMGKSWIRFPNVNLNFTCFRLPKA